LLRVALMRDSRGLVQALLSVGTKLPANNPTFIPFRERPPVVVAGVRGCGDYRLWPAACGDCRAGYARDEHRPAVVCA